MVAVSKLSSGCRRTLLRGLLALSLLRASRKRQQQARRKTRPWTRGLFKPGQQGDYEVLYQKLEDDRELYFRYMRMSKERFNHLLSLIEDEFQGKDDSLGVSLGISFGLF